MKDAFYFSHDSNARSDIKIQALRSQYGMKGYGMYWVVIEMLRESTDHKLPLNQSFAYYGFANEFHCNVEEAKKFIHDCIYEFALFFCDDNHFWSDSLNRRMDKYKLKASIKAENGMKGGRPKKQATEPLETIETSIDKPKKEKPITSQNATVAQYSVEVNQLTDLLIKKIKENNPNAKSPNFNQWCDSIRLILENDGYSFDDVKQMIEFSQSNDFWKSNILSAKKLREKAGTLILQMRREGDGTFGKVFKRPVVEVTKYEGLNDLDISPERIAEIRGKAKEVEELLRMRKVP